MAPHKKGLPFLELENLTYDKSYNVDTLYCMILLTLVVDVKLANGLYT